MKSEISNYPIIPMSLRRDTLDAAGACKFYYHNAILFHKLGSSPVVYVSLRRLVLSAVERRLQRW